MNEGCGNEIAANIKDGLIGCFDGEFVAKFLCGLSLTVLASPMLLLASRTLFHFSRHAMSRARFCLQVKHGDLSTVQTEGNLFWPRVLLNGSEDANGDGQGGMHLECTDPIDCLQVHVHSHEHCPDNKLTLLCLLLQKCRYLERTARHGFGAPPACALCDQYCSSNLATTIMDVRAALFDDVLTVGRLISSCFGNVRATSLNLNPTSPLAHLLLLSRTQHGLAGCICQFAVRASPLAAQVVLCSADKTCRTPRVRSLRFSPRGERRPTPTRAAAARSAAKTATRGTCCSKRWTLGSSTGLRVASTR